MKKIIFLGAKEIGFFCLQQLYKNSTKWNIKVIGVLTNSRGKKIIDFCKKNNIRIIEGLTQLEKESSFDIGISVQYHKILKPGHINKAKDIFLNLHMAPLPEYRGCNQFSYAILDNAKEFGVTIHRLESGIDSGAIISERRFSIPERCWVKELLVMSVEQAKKLFLETIPNIIKQNYTLTPQDKLLKFRSTSIHYRKEIKQIKKINLEWSAEKIMRHVRASYMPGFEPPYFLIDKKKVYMQISDDQTESINND